MTSTRKWVLMLVIAGAVVLGVGSPASAVTAEQKLAALSDFTQTTAGSYNYWDSARLNQGAWADYELDWSTDYCSASPDSPLGFDFRMPCYRHDFGYRNYKLMTLFDLNKARIDSAFHEDLKRKCATYHWSVRSACNSLAWTYYTAVRNFGSTAAVTKEDIRRAERLMPAETVEALP